jgi:hypothetical protein
MKNKNKIFGLLFGTFLIAMLTACGNESSSSSAVNGQSFFYTNGIFQYQLSDLTANCQTGEHQFESLAAMCSGLESASLNSNCALTLRTAYFAQAGCAGSFQQTQ